jgi:hypothetical protein
LVDAVCCEETLSDHTATVPALQQPIGEIIQNRAERPKRRIPTMNLWNNGFEHLSLLHDEGAGIDTALMLPV